MNILIIIQDILIILLASLPIIFIFKKLNIPTIVGFLIAGIIIGPYGFRLIKSLQEIEVMAEIGVMLLLFTIGLEVSFAHLTKIKKYLIVVGGAQVIATIILATGIFYFLGISIKQSFFFAMLVTLSSTAVVLKLLSDRKELEAPQGKISVGILVFQDLMIVPMFLVLPIISADASVSMGNLILKIFIAFGSLSVLIIIARFLMPKIIFQIASLKLSEAFTIGIILLLLGLAYLTHSLGLSFALGAFIAGLILAETDYNTHALSVIVPLRDSFNTIFFVSIGLLLDLSYITENPVIIISTTFSIVILKAIIIMVILATLKFPLRIAIITGLGLAQIGEFSFILAKTGLNFNLISNEIYKIFLASTIFTMILTPFMIRIANSLMFRKSKNTFKKDELESTGQTLADHVIIAGYGLNGKSLARVLSETGIKYIVVELNPQTVKMEKENKKNIIFGDICQSEILHEAGIHNAKVLVFAISDPKITKRGLKIAKEINGNIFAVARIRYVSEIEEIKKSGADIVVPEELESSLEIFKKVLQHYHIPMNIIMKQTGILRGESYQLLRNEDKQPEAFIHLDEILAEGLTETYFIDDNNFHIGRKLEEINLRKMTNATIIAIVRESKTISNPSGKEKIYGHDTLVITGDHNSVDAAIKLFDGETI